ncbi:MAG: hypothetical protein AAF403_08080 [Pseudomonadota bacterium]
MVEKSKYLEWLGVITAIIYSLLVALNIGWEFIAFIFLFVSSIAIGIWAYLGGYKGMILLQVFYACAAIIGMIRWLND